MKKLTCILLTAVIALSAAVISSCNSNNDKNEEKEFDPKAAVLSTTAPAATSADSSKKVEKKTTETEPEVKVSKSTELSSSQYKSFVSSCDSLVYNYGFEGEVYITEHGKPIYKNSVNYADKKKKTKINEYTLFRVASITKQFTAAAIMILNERKKLSLKDKLGKYFPEYKNGKDVTIDQVLRMRGGIPDYMNFYSNVAMIFPNKKEAFKNSSEKNRAYIKKAFMEDPLLFTPGATFKYSNSGYLLLGEIVEKVSGTSYENFVQTEIFDKLGMKYSGFNENLDDSNPNIAKPYNYRKGQLDVFSIDGAAFACGNIYSNAVDLNKWAYGLRHNKIMSAKSFKKMVSDPNKVGYAYGLFTMESGNLVHHTGNLAPYNSIILMSLGSSDYTCIVLSNYNYYASETLGKNLRSVYSGYFSS
ncbi:MAG: beta-lactamase family protein [Ruminococcus sp.]|nr:beta-lactamase family protein [Ruminococcus sp.]